MVGSRLMAGPAVAFIIVYAFLLLCIPSQLIIRALGAPGNPANLWGLLALTWWIIATAGGLNPTIRPSPVRVLALTLALAVLASYVVGMANGWYAPVGLKQETDDILNLVPVTVTELSDRSISAADRGLLSMGGWLGIVLLATDGLRGWPDIERLTRWITWFAGFVAAIGILQFFTGMNIASYFTIPGLSANADFGAASIRSVVRRVSSTAVHPIEFGVVLSALFPLALHVAITHWPKKSTSIPAVLIGIAIPMSVSRSAILGLIVSLTILIAGWPKAWRIKALILTPIAAVVMRLMIPGLLGTILSLFTNISNDPSVEGRTADYDVVLSMARDHILFGRGLFTFLPELYRILDNQLLLSLVELGLVGLSCVLLLFAGAFISARIARRKTTSASNRNLALSISAGVAGIVVSYATFDAWGFPMAAGTTFLLVGMAGSSWMASVTDRADERAA